MEQIIKDLENLEKKLNDYKATAEEQRKYNLIKSYIALAVNAASFNSRVKTNPNSSAQAAKLNAQFQELPKPEKKKRVRPKKENKPTNVLADNAGPKTLSEKLAKDAKK